jgi:hypothetical protein
VALCLSEQEMSRRRICSRRFDRKTLKLTEAPWCMVSNQILPSLSNSMLRLPTGAPGLNSVVDTNRHGTIDPETGETKYYPLAAEWNDRRVHLNFVGLRHDVDGKVCSQGSIF